MGRKLVGNVSVQNPKTFETQTFEAGADEADIPAWARKAIGNPFAWDDAPVRDERVAIIRGRLSANGATDEQVDRFAETLTSEDRVVEALLATEDVGTLRESIQAAQPDEPAASVVWIEGESYAEYVARATQADLVPVSEAEWEAHAAPSADVPPENTPDTAGTAAP